MRKLLSFIILLIGSISTANPPDLQYSKVKLINNFETTQKVYVNDELYELKPGEIFILNYIMPGNFTYKVVGVHENNLEKTIAANEVFTIKLR